MAAEPQPFIGPPAPPAADQGLPFVAIASVLLLLWAFAQSRK